MPENDIRSEYHFRYQSTPLLEYPPNYKPLFVDWNSVISRMETTTLRVVGRTMEAVETLGLTEKQESALKNTLKRLIYTEANLMMDDLTFNIVVPKHGAQDMEKPEGEGSENGIHGTLKTPDQE